MATIPGTNLTPEERERNLQQAQQRQQQEAQQTIQQTGGARYQPLDADVRKRAEQEYKAAQKAALEREKSPRTSQRMLEDILYEYGTGTSGLLRAQEIGLLTPGSSRQFEQDVLSRQLSQAKGTFALGQRDVSAAPSIMASQEQRRREGRMPTAQPTGVYASTAVPSMAQARGYEYTPGAERLTPMDRDTRVQQADERVEQMYKDIETGAGFTGVKTVHPEAARINEIENQMANLVHQKGISRSEKEDRRKELMRELLRLKSIREEETPEYQAWKQEQTILADKARGEMARQQIGGDLAFGEDASRAALGMEGALDFRTPEQQYQAPTTQLGTPTDRQEQRVLLEQQGQITGNVNPYTGQVEPVQMGGYQAMPSATTQYESFTNQQLGGAQEMARMGMNLAQEEYSYKQGATRDKLLMSLRGTDFFNKAEASGYNPYNMTVDQIRGFLAVNGYEVNQEDKERIQASGATMIDNLVAEKNDAFAQIDLTRKAIEREYGRALDDIEQQNIANDNALKKMVAAFGGGRVESIAGNMEVLRAREKGERIKSDLLADFGDKQTMISLQANQVLRTYTQNVNNVQSYMAEEEGKLYQEISGRVDELIDQGVTNTTDLISAMGEYEREYMNKVMDINQKGFEIMEEHSKWLADYDLKIRREQRAEDNQMMEAYGVMYKNGQPLLDQMGNVIPTMDRMKFDNQVDQQMSQQTGYLYMNGQPVIDQAGNMVPTYDREQFFTQEARRAYEFDESQKLAKDRISISRDQYDLARDKFSVDSAVAAFEMDRALAAEGWNMGRIDPNTGQISVNEGIFKTDGSKYTPVFDGQKVRIDIPTDENGVMQLWNKARGQCGEFVNDVLGWIDPGDKVFGDSFKQKMTKVVSAIPKMGSAFVQATQGKYGHVGIVEGVEFDESGRPISMEIVDSNYKGNEKLDRARVSVSYDKNGNPVYTRDDGSKMLIKGYTDSFLGSEEAIGNKIAQQQEVETMTDPFGRTYTRQISPEGAQVSSMAMNYVEMIKKGEQKFSDVPQAHKDEVTAYFAANPEESQNLGGVEKLPATTITMLADAKYLPDVLGSLDSMIRTADDPGIGLFSDKPTFDPISGFTRSIMPYDTGQQRANAELLLAAQLVGKFLEGGVLKKEDERKYQNMLPKSTDTREVAMSKLQNVKQKLEEKRLGYLDAFGSQGYNIQPFLDVPKMDTSGFEDMAGSMSDVAKVQAVAGSGMSEQQKLYSLGLPNAPYGQMYVISGNQVGLINRNEFDPSLYRKL